MRLKPFLYAAALLLVVVGFVVGTKALQIVRLSSSSEGGQGPPPETVSTTEVVLDRWDRSVESVGSLRAVQGADLSTESAGMLSKILFQSGEEVEKGDLLVELDTASEQANLRAAQAEADLARTVYQRTRKLRANSTVPQSELDSADSNLRMMDALVEQIKANIGKKQLRAPFSGRLGIREANLGQFLDQGDKIVSLQSFDPIFVEFLLPQQLLSRIALGQSLRVTTDVYPDEVFPGELTAINPEIDRVTRNIRLQGTLDNPGGGLRSGMFSRVILMMDGTDEVVRIPVTAVLQAPFGDSVFVVLPPSEGGSSLLVEQRFIHTGPTRGDFVSVVEGLQPGETVVSAGAFKLRNGSSIVVNNEMAPRPQLDPKPDDT